VFFDGLVGRRMRAMTSSVRPLLQFPLLVRIMNRARVDWLCLVTCRRRAFGGAVVARAVRRCRLPRARLHRSAERAALRAA